MRRTIRFWWKKLLKKGIPQEFLVWLTPQEEEMQRRIFHFRWIKGVLLLRSTSGKRSGFSCWALIHQTFLKPSSNLSQSFFINIWNMGRGGRVHAAGLSPPPLVFPFPEGRVLVPYTCLLYTSPSPRDS